MRVGIVVRVSLSLLARVSLSLHARVSFSLLALALVSTHAVSQAHVDPPARDVLGEFWLFRPHLRIAQFPWRA